MTSNPYSRLTPDDLLRQLQAQQKHFVRGRLKIFLGYASGVGKSFRMLDEGRRRKMRGEDVVVGALQANTPPEVDALLCDCEIIPPKIIEGVPVLDVEAVRRRRPQVCLIDGLAYDNPLGALHQKRWQDVEDLLDAGISIVATVNLQYIEGEQDAVAKITGKAVGQTIPRNFVNTADEIEVVDAPPELALQRASDSASRDRAGPLAQQLSELRELALVLAAEVVDHQLEEYLHRHGIEMAWGVQERILLCITRHPNAAPMIASGRRNADRFHGELLAVYVDDETLSDKEKLALEANLTAARKAGAQVEVLQSEDPTSSVIDFARAHGVTQIFLGHSTHRGWRSLLRGSFVTSIIRAAEGIDVRVFPH